MQVVVLRPRVREGRRSLHQDRVRLILPRYLHKELRKVLEKDELKQILDIKVILTFILILIPSYLHTTNHP